MDYCGCFDSADSQVLHGGVVAQADASGCVEYGPWDEVGGVRADVVTRPAIEHPFVTRVRIEQNRGAHSHHIEGSGDVRRYRLWIDRNDIISGLSGTPIPLHLWV